MNTLKLNSSIIICGKPRTGKSHLIKYILYLFTCKKGLYERLSYGLVFTKTKFNHAYDYIPHSRVYDHYDPEALKQLMDIQSSIREQGYIPPYAFVVFDDCLGAFQFKSDLFKDLISNYRHYNIVPIISSQFITRIETVNRECVSHACIFRQYSKNAIRSCYESFGQRFDKESEFKEYMLKNTGSYKFILVNNESMSDDINSVYRVLKAPARIPDPHMPYNQSIDLSELKCDSA